jgi:hypothetical protein
MLRDEIHAERCIERERPILEMSLTGTALRISFSRRSGSSLHGGGQRQRLQIGKAAHDSNFREQLTDRSVDERLVLLLSVINCLHSLYPVARTGNSRFRQADAGWSA